MSSSITITGVHKRFGDREVLRGMDLEIPAGSVTGLIGESGSGKTTLLRCLNGMEHIDEGTIRIGDMVLTPESTDEEHRTLRKTAGMVFQQFHLWPHCTALENVIEAPMLLLGMQRTAAEERAENLLRRMGMEGYEQRRPLSLSGGQQQRVALARAMAMEPSILLLDEITSSLDPSRKREILQLVRQMATESGRTIILATHELGLAREIADTVVTLRDGRIV